MPDYIPGGDAEFGAWLTNFVTYANANLVALGLVAGDMTPVTNAQTTWNSAYPAHGAASADIAPARRWAVATGEAPPAQRAKRKPWKMARILDAAPTGRRRRPVNSTGQKGPWSDTATVGA